MTLLEHIYEQLSKARLTESAKAFSRDYLGKSRSWYAVQTHERRDFSISAAIACLRNIRAATHCHTISKQQQLALMTAEHLVSLHLSKHHAVADIC